MTSEIDDILPRSFLRASDLLAAVSPAKRGSPAVSLGSKEPGSGAPHLAAEEPNPRMPHSVSKEPSTGSSVVSKEFNSKTPRLAFKEPGSGVTSLTPTKTAPRKPYLVSKEPSIGSTVASKEPNTGTHRFTSPESASGVTPPTPTKPDPCAGLIQLFRRHVFTDDDDASAGGRATYPESASARLRALLPVYDERARLVGYLTRGARIAPPACPSGSHPHPFRPPVFVDVRKLVPRTGCSAECSAARYVSLLTNVNPKAVWVPSKALKEAAKR